MARLWHTSNKTKKNCLRQRRAHPNMFLVQVHRCLIHLHLMWQHSPGFGYKEKLLRHNLHQDLKWVCSYLNTIQMFLHLLEEMILECNKGLLGLMRLHTIVSYQHQPSRLNNLIHLTNLHKYPNKWLLLVEIDYRRFLNHLQKSAHQFLLR